VKVFTCPLLFLCCMVSMVSCTREPHGDGYYEKHEKQMAAEVKLYNAARRFAVQPTESNARAALRESYVEMCGHLPLQPIDTLFPPNCLGKAIRATCVGWDFASYTSVCTASSPR
jgi:hypothetical protein